MNVLVVIDVLNGHNGTFKLMRNLTSGFEKNNNVKIVIFGKSDDYENVVSLLNNLNYVIVESKYSLLFEQLIRKLVTRKHSNFKLDDIPSFTPQLYLFKYVKKWNFKPDLVIFSNIFSSISLILNHSYKSIVLLHEAPLFDDFPKPFQRFMCWYINLIAKRAKYLSISNDIALKTERKFQFQIFVKPPIAFFDKEIKNNKEKIILLDTRWTIDRDPFFVLEIATLMKEVKIIMHGFFPDQFVKKELTEKIRINKLNIELISEDTESELEALYEKAAIVVRWSGLHESGNPLSIMYAVSNNCIPVIDEHLGPSKFIQNNISEDIVVKRDPESFSNVILRLIRDENYYMSIVENVIKCKRQFSWENFSSSLIDMYK